MTQIFDETDNVLLQVNVGNNMSRTHQQGSSNSINKKRTIFLALCEMAL